MSNTFVGLSIKPLLLGLTLIALPLITLSQEQETEQTREEVTQAGEEVEEVAVDESELDALKHEEERLHERLESLLHRREEFSERLRQASGEDLLILQRQSWQRQLETHTTIVGLADNLLHQEEEGRDVGEQKAELKRFLEANYKNYPLLIERYKEQIADLRTQLEEDPEADQISIDQKIAEGESRLQRGYQAMIEILPVIEALGIGIPDMNEQAVQMINERAERIAGRVEILYATRDDLQQRLVSSPDDEALKQELETTELRLDHATDNLSATVALMSSLDLDPVEYQQLLIVATGELTADILNKEVALGLFERWRDNIVEQITNEGPSWLVKLAFFLLILAGFRVLAALVRRLVMKSVGGSSVNISRLLQDTLVSWSSRIVMLIGLLVALGQLGVQIGPLLTGLGIAGFIIGFALQDSLSNFAAGAMILIYEPFDEGDVVEAAGIIGKVSRMSLVSTTILTFDNQTLMVPNNKIWGDVIRNVTAQQIRRVDLTFRTAYTESVEKVETTLHEVLAAHDKVLDDPEPLIKLHKLGEYALEFIVRPWCSKDDYWDVYWGLTREVKLRFEKEGIAIPLPRQDVHIVSADDQGRST
ncbi:MAG: mechanosensitive ion channel domain-containing protein [Pseudomonadota bacterium]